MKLETPESQNDAKPRKTGALSPSRIKDFHNCPLKFRLRMIDQLPEPPSTAALRGTIVHSVLENLFDEAAKDRTEAQAQAALQPAWDAHIAEHPQDLEMFTSETERAQWLESARPLLSAYFRLENPQYLEPVGREHYVRTQLPSGIAIHGFIDRLDQAPNGALRVVDYKSGKAPAPRFQEEYLFQMRFYAAALYFEQGTLPARTQLLFLKDAKVLTYDPTDFDVRSVTAQVESAWHEIKARALAGSFEPRANKLCDWCYFQDSCPAFGGEPPEVPADRVDYLLSVEAK